MAHNTPDELKYTEEHEWVKLVDDYVVIGITDFAQSSLGDIVFNGVGGLWSFNASATTSNFTITNGTTTLQELLTITGNYTNNSMVKSIVRTSVGKG